MRRRQKILFVVTVDWFFCSHFLGRAIAAREAGYEVVLATCVDRHGEIIRSAGLGLIHVPISRRSLNPLNAFRTILHLKAIYNRERPDVIHHVAIKPILLGGLAARLAGSRHLINAVVGGGYAFTSQKLSTRLLRPILRFGLRLLLNPYGSKVVFENKDDLDSFITAGLVKRIDSVLIRGAGVDPELFAKKKAYGVPVVVLTARLLWDKGIREFVEAARLLLRKGISARFVVIGKQDEENRANIDDASLDKWRSEGAVEFWGFRDDIPKILGEATVACLPSYREGLPKSLLEAMASGLPCVATNVPGCREAVIDGDNGLLVPPRNAEALADAIERLLNDPALAKKMGERGRERVLEEFSAQQVNQQHLAIYAELTCEAAAR